MVEMAWRVRTKTVQWTYVRECSIKLKRTLAQIFYRIKYYARSVVVYTFRIYDYANTIQSKYRIQHYGSMFKSYSG